MTDLHHCPNCDALISDKVGSCSSCGAEFGPGSAWKPVPASQRIPPSDRPELANAAQAIAVFTILGPWLGLVLGVLARGSANALPAAFHPLAVVGAFVVGATPAVVAGLIFAFIARALVVAFPRFVVGALAGAAIGGAAGYAAGAGCFYWTAVGDSKSFEPMLQWANLSAMTGAICGFVSAWFRPVGAEVLR